MSNTSDRDDTGLGAIFITIVVVVPVIFILLTTCGCCYFWRIRNTKRRKAALRARGPQPPAYSRTPPIKLPVYLPKKPEQARNGDCV